MDTKNEMDILKIRVDNLLKEEITEQIDVFLSNNKFHQIATVNPEFILKAQRDDGFKNIINTCDLNVADGIGIKFAFWRFGKRLKTRIAGVDLMDEVLKIAAEKNLSIFLAADKEGLSTWKETREAILKKYPKLEISGADMNKTVVIAGSKAAKQSYVSAEKNDEAAALLSAIRNNIIFCAFGAPHQEKFLHSLKSLKNSKIRLVMGVGGSFDFLSGKIKRAPAPMRTVGMEWFWRLILEPRYRLKRIFRVVAIFPIKVIFKCS